MSTPAYQNLERLPIAGQWREGTSGRTLTVTDPFNGDTLLSLSMASHDDLDAAYRGAQAAQQEWAAMGPTARGDIMRRVVGLFDARKEEIIEWLTRESGSTRVKAEIEWGSARAITQEAASLPGRMHGRILPSDVPGKQSLVYRKPLGVVGVISPWNFPLHLSARSVAPALALGNAVVVKPASDTPVTGGLLLARLFEEAGLPPGVLSVVVGAGSEIGDAFVEHPIPSFISFTGSTAVGRNIGRSKTARANREVSTLHWMPSRPGIDTLAGRQFATLPLQIVLLSASLTINDDKRLTRHSFDSLMLDGHEVVSRKRKSKHSPGTPVYAFRYRDGPLLSANRRLPNTNYKCYRMADPVGGWRCLRAPICGWCAARCCREVGYECARMLCGPPLGMRGRNSGCSQRRNTDINTRASSLRFEEQTKLI